VLVLISFGLVLVATVLLVLGLVADSGLGLIYVSIACSLAAGVILLVATRVNRQRTEPAAVPTGPAPLPPPEAPAVTAAPVAATPPPEPAPEVDAEAFAPSTQETPAVSTPAAAAAADEDEMFPIADYDDLTVGEIMPLLPKLYADEIDVVMAREESGKSRRQIVARLEELRDSMDGAPDDLTAEEWAEQRASAPAVKKTAAKREAAPAKKTAKAPAKKSSAAKKAASTTKKAAAPAKKATAKKAAAPAKKATATTKKAASASKKAATPAKKTPTKATKATKATKKR
jgi:hypothetical protein